jgi:hypothetical protein
MKNPYLQEATEIIRKQQGPRGPVWMCGEQLLVYSRGRLVYVADLGQIMLAKLTPTGKETKC